MASCNPSFHQRADLLAYLTAARRGWRDTLTENAGDPDANVNVALLDLFAGKAEVALQRLEKLKAENTALTSPAGRFAPERSFPTTPNLPNWTDIASRFGLAYDLRGNGKTALKFSLNRYNDSRTTGIAAQYNPLALATARLTWRDVNGDDIAQGALGCVYLTTNCEINFAQLPANFGVRALATADPNLQRPYQLSTNLGVQHELRPGVSVTAASSCRPIAVVTAVTNSTMRVLCSLFIRFRRPSS